LIAPQWRFIKQQNPVLQYYQQRKVKILFDKAKAYANMYETFVRMSH